MNLQLAIISSCTDAGCRVQFLNDDTPVGAVYSESLKDYGIGIYSGDLVAVDVETQPPRIVYRWRLTRVERIENERLFVESEPGHPFKAASGLQAAVGERVFADSDQVFTVDANGYPAAVELFQTICFPRIVAMYQSLDTLYSLGPKRVVEQGYDRISEAYTGWHKSGDAEVRNRYITILVDHLPAGAKVLDLGCGAGIPITVELARHFAVTGVDFSAKQIEQARRNIPQGQFLQADMTQLTFPAASFDGVAAFYSIIHVPREEQPKLLKDIASWLRPGGLLVITMGIHDGKVDFEADWLGTLMYWSHFDGETNRRLVEEAGLKIISAREETQLEDGQPVTFLWVVAEKPIR